MFQPGILDFKDTDTYVTAERKNIDSDKDFNILDGLDSYILDQVSIAIPDCRFVPTSVSDYLKTEGPYYTVINLSISELIDEDFVRNFVFKGHINVAMSAECEQFDNFFTFCTDGILNLSLSDATYIELGIEGSNSEIKGKHDVLIFTKSPNFFGNKKYERLKWCFANCLELKFDVVIEWQPPDHTVCPSSIANYLHKKGYQVKESQLNISSSIKYLDQRPIVQFIEDEPDNFADWLGAAHLGLNGEEFCSGGMTVDCPHLASTIISGLFPHYKLKQLCSTLKNYLDENETIPWLAITIHTLSPQSDKSKINSSQKYVRIFKVAILVLIPNNSEMILIVIQD